MLTMKDLYVAKSRALIQEGLDYRYEGMDIDPELVNQANVIQQDHPVHRGSLEEARKNRKSEVEMWYVHCDITHKIY